jgi:hypothetical protein
MTQEDEMQTELTAEDKSKDEFFERLANLSEEMVAKHGKDFSMGRREPRRQAKDQLEQLQEGVKRLSQRNRVKTDSWSSSPFP